MGNLSKHDYHHPPNDQPAKSRPPSQIEPPAIVQESQRVMDAMESAGMNQYVEILKLHYSVSTTIAIQKLELSERSYYDQLSRAKQCFSVSLSAIRITPAKS